MIKYLGSKRRLVGVLGELAENSGAATALDLFTGTTRVAQEFCRRGLHTTAVDLASYSEVFAQCYVELDADTLTTEQHAELAEALDWLGGLAPVRGYVTEMFCEQARYFQPDNGQRIDAIRAGIDRRYGASWLRPVLLTSLIEAADRVDSTIGLHMAYLKNWSARSHSPLRLRAPVLVPGTGRAVRGDATKLVDQLPPADLAYLDPPYNQHRYFTNYHIWETLVRWDEPETYGVARKRADAREPETRTVLDSRRTMPAALAELIARVRAEVVVVSFNDEGFVPLDDLVDMCRVHGEVEVLAFDSRRHIGHRIGVHNLRGEVVGEPGRGRNLEYVLVAGAPDVVARTVPDRALLPSPTQ
ncbi:DNA adenine methylase [Enemella sp. A6]|uniref:DNA adenine methylase n=1 Tax=Enemella sp. A6 TaxID=3440152 RepID=UPI003EBDEE07